MATLPATCRPSARRDGGVIRPRLRREMLVTLPGEPDRVVAERDGRVLRWILGRAAARQAFDQRVVVRITEEWDGVTIARRTIDYAVGRRQEPFVRPAVQ